MGGAEDVWHDGSEEDAPGGDACLTTGGADRAQLNSEDSIPVDLPCHVCNDPGQWERMLPVLCDGGCKRGFHLDCIGFSKIPKGDWFCEDCTAEHSAQFNNMRQPLVGAVLLNIFFYFYIVMGSIGSMGGTGSIGIVLTFLLTEY
jgi:hypothetical protein